MKNFTPLFQASEFLNIYGKKLKLKEMNRAVLCFNSSIAKKISQKYKSERIFALGAAFDVYKDYQTVVVSQFGFGAPAALLQLEYLKNFGIKEFFTLGTACSFSSELKVADGVLIQKAYGFYKKEEIFVENPHLEDIKKYCEKFQLKPVSSWTSDAPFRESEEDRALYVKKGVSCFEMEAASLMEASKQDDLKMMCFAFISDRRDEKLWEVNFSHSSLQEGFFQTLEQLLQSS